MSDTWIRIIGKQAEIAASNATRVSGHTCMFCGGVAAATRSLECGWVYTSLVCVNPRCSGEGPVMVGGRFQAAKR